MSLNSIKINTNEVIKVDEQPTVGSDNLVKSGGICGTIEISSNTVRRYPEEMLTQKEIGKCYYINGNGTIQIIDSSLYGLIISSELIPVNQGDILIYSGGHSASSLCLVGGYSDIDCTEGFVNLLSGGTAYENYKITIPAGVKYVLAWSVTDLQFKLMYAEAAEKNALRRFEYLTRKNIPYNAFDDYKTGYILGEQYTPATNSDSSFILSSLMPVKEGSVIYYSRGWQQNAILKLVCGYTDAAYSNPTPLLASEEYYDLAIIKIPSGIKYVQAFGYIHATKHRLMFLSNYHPDEFPVTYLEYNTNSGGLLSFLNTNVINPERWNKYMILVDEGTYDLTSEAITQRHGIMLPSFVGLKGVNGKENTVFKVELNDYDLEICTFSIARDCYLEDLTIQCTKGRYAIHDDFGYYDTFYKDNAVSKREYKQYFKNCILEAIDCSNSYAFGAGTYAGANWIFDNCQFISDKGGFYVHSNINYVMPAHITLINCKSLVSNSQYLVNTMMIQSLTSGTDNILTMKGCVFDAITVKANNLTPSAIPDWKFIGYGNKKDCQWFIEGTNFGTFKPQFSDVLTNEIINGYMLGSQRYNNGVLEYWNGSSWVQ